MTSMDLARIVLVFLAVARGFALAQMAGPTTGPTTAPVVAPVSAEFKVSVNGRPIYVYDAPVASVAQFDFTGPAEVVVETSGRDVKWADIRPQRWGLRPVCDGRTIRFTLQQPGKFSIELNGLSLQRPLFLFADPPEENAPKAGDPGVRYFAAGQVHEAGAINVKSGETVYLAPGSIVRGWIHAEGAKDIRICGRGILLGTNTSDLPGRRRSRFVHFMDCSNVTVEGITLIDSPGWQVVPVRCENVTIRNVKIVSDNASDDGMDIVNSHHVRIEDCFVRTKDDCVAIKSNAGPVDAPGTRDVAVSGCVFWNAAWGNAVEIGFELAATEVSNIVFRNCDVIHVQDGAVFSIHNADCATVRDVRVEDIRVEDTTQKVFDLAIFLSQYSVDRPADPQERKARYLAGAWDGVLSVSPEQHALHAPHRGHVRDIVFKDIALVDGRFPFSLIVGFDDEHLVENVTFDNFTVRGRKISSADEGQFHIEHARGIQFK